MLAVAVRACRGDEVDRLARGVLGIGVSGGLGLDQQLKQLAGLRKRVLLRNIQERKDRSRLQDVADCTTASLR